jgi:hypothetical protein
MASLNDALDSAVDVTTGSAELVAAKWKTVAAVVIAALVLVFLLILFFTMPTYGLAALLAFVAIVYLLQQGDSLV